MERPTSPTEPTSALERQTLALGDGQALGAAWADEVRRHVARAEADADPTTIAVRALEAAEWDPERAARGAAELLARSGRPDEACERLVTAARRLEIALAFDRAAALYEDAAAISGVNDERIDDALLRGARARATADDDIEARAATWQQLLDRALERDDAQAVARAQYHLYWCAPESMDPQSLLDAAGVAGEDGWHARARGLAAMNEERLDEAIEWNRRALGWARDQGDQYLEAIALEGIGLVLTYQGRLEETIGLLRESIAINERDGDIAAALFVRCNLAELLCQQLQPHAAAEECVTLRKLVPSTAAEHWSGMVGMLEARVARYQGDVTRALELVRESIDPFRGGGPSMMDCVALLTALQTALDAGDLALAREVAEPTAMSVQRVGFPGFERHEAWLRVRLDALEDDVPVDAMVTHAVAGLDGADEWLRASAATQLAWEAMVRGSADDVRACRTLLDGLETGGDPLVELASRTASAVLDLVDGDDRPLRMALRAWDAAGMPLERERCAAMLGLGSSTQDLDRVHAARAWMEEAGAIPDADLLAERLRARGAGGGAAQHLPVMRGIAATHVSRLVARLDACAVRANAVVDVNVDDVLLLDADAKLRIDDDHGLALVAGPLAAVRVPRGIEACHGLADGRAWKVTGAEFDAWLEQASAEDRGVLRERLDAGVGIVARDGDTTADSTSRVRRVLARLDIAFGIEVDDERRVDMPLIQLDIAQLAATSRKSATTLLAELRRSNIADVRRGVIRVLDRDRLFEA